MTTAAFDERDSPQILHVGSSLVVMRSATQLCHNVFWLKTQTTAKIHLFSTCNNKAEASSAHNMDILLTFKWIW